MSDAASREWFIYVLKNPDTNEIRYVGKTCQPKTRLNFHVSNARRSAVANGTRTRVANWILGLLNGGKLPEMEVIISRAEDPNKAERETIAAFRAAGYRLTNLTEGGDGTSGHQFSAESRKRLSESLRGKKKTLSCEQRQAMAARARINLKAYRDTLSPEEKSRTARDRATARWKRRMPEEKQAILKAVAMGRQAKEASKPPKPPRVDGRKLVTPEWRKNLSLSHMGQTQGASARWSKPGERERMSLVAKDQMKGDCRMAKYMACLSPERRKEIAAKSVATRKANRELKAKAASA